MKRSLKIFVLLMVILMLVISGCSGSTKAVTEEASGSEEGEISLVASATSAPTKKTSTLVVESTEPVTSEETSITATPYPTSAPATCNVIGKSLVADPIYPEVTEEDWIEGAKEAPVTILLYSDFQCPYCSALEGELQTLLKEYSGEVRVVFRQFPLISIHGDAQLAAQAAEAAGKQGYENFFKMKSLLFAEQNTWSGMSLADFTQWLVLNAEIIGLDKTQFENDLTSQAIVDKVNAAIEAGTAAGVQGTPTMIFNGVAYGGPRDAETLGSIIKLFQLEENLYTECPEMTIDSSKEYTAILHTTKGDVTIQLLADAAPMAVNNFIFLAKDGYYDNTPFHRVLEDFVAQTGDPSGTGYGGPGYRFTNEVTSDLTFDAAGVVAMANANTTDSNGSQFFITYAALPELNGGYTIFGKVIEGMDVVYKLTLRDPSSEEALPKADLILSIDIEEK